MTWLTDEDRDAREDIRSDKDLAEDYRRGMEAQDRMIAGYQRDIELSLAERDRLLRKLAAVREALGKIVESEGIDAGVILLSSESPTHYNAELKCQVYEHECFSELGDALVALARMAKDDETTMDGAKTCEHGIEEGEFCLACNRTVCGLN